MKKTAELKNENTNIQLLSEIGQEIITNLSIEAIIEKVYKNVNRLMDATAFGIGIFNKEKSRLDFPGFIEKGEKLPFWTQSSLDDTGRPAIWCFNNQKEIFINDFVKEYNIYFPNSPVPKPLAGEQSAALIYIPLTVQDKKIGVITVQSFKKNAYSDYHLGILRNLAVYVSIALENARIYENLEEKIEERTKEVTIQKDELERSFQNIKLLSEIGQQITGTLSIEAIIAKVYDNINRLMDATAFGIGIFNTEQNRLDFPGFMEKGEMLPFRFQNLEDKNRLAVWCFKNRKEIFINDYQKDFNNYFPSVPIPKAIAGELPESVIYVPLLAKDKAIGIITVQSFRKNSYTDYHLNILRSLSVYVATALENAQLYENMENKVEERTNEVMKQKEALELSYKNIQVLSEIGQEITAMLSVETIIEKVYEKINTLMDASVFLIGIYDAEIKKLSVPGSMEKGEKFPVFYWDLKDKKRPAVWCYEQQKEIFINDFVKEYNIYFPNEPAPKPVSGEQSESLVYIPLTIQHKKIGVLSVQSFKKNAYTDYHLGMLRNLAVYVSIAIENARLYENMEAEVKQRTQEVIKQKEELEEKSKALQGSYHNITLLSQIGQKITSTLHLEKILDTVYENVNVLMDATEFGIGVYMEEENVIDMQLSFYESKKIVEENNKVSMLDDNRLSVWCVKNKKEVFINDMENEFSKYIPSLSSYDNKQQWAFVLQSLICLPLVIEEKVCGLIYIQSRQKNAYTQLQLEMARTLASYTAVALNNAEAYKKLNVAMQEVEKLSVVVSKTDNAVIIASPKGKIEWVNEGFTKMTGYTLQSLIQEKGDDLFKSSGNAEIEKSINECIANKKSMRYEVANYTKDGRQLWIQTTLSPITDNNGNVVKLATIDSDITERKIAEMELGQKNKEITDSINYAKKIQETIIPSQDQLKQLFPNSFVLFKPKDIVSGDFYWLDEKNGKAIIAVVDCTGHGVPGAFMSIIGNTLLNDIVHEKGILKPNEILNELRKNVIHSLKQTGQSGEQQDGMDVAICVFDFAEKKMEFSGAYNPIYIVRNQELSELKADRMPVGISETMNTPFTNHEYFFQEGDVFYIFSDGFKDQFGGSNRKKLTSIRFKKVLLSTFNENMSEQKQALDSAFEDWKENLEQVDDICVCGIRV